MFDMKFGILIGQIGKIGGMERQAVLLASELRNRGFDVALFVAGIPQRKCGSLDVGSVRCKFLHLTRLTGFISEVLLRRYIKKYRITHLVAFNVENAELALNAGAECRLALNVRGIRFKDDPILAEKYRRVSSRCDWVITNSKNTSLLLHKNGITAQDNIKVINNAVPVPDNSAVPEEKNILYVGSLKEVKDPMTFVRACRHVVKSDSAVNAVMAGDGPMRPSIEKYISENKLETNLSLLGEMPLDKIPYTHASVYVNSSLRESSSNSLLEALSFGVPVVAADNPGNRNTLANLHHHRLVPVSDWEAMAAAIQDLLNIDKGMRSKIAEESRNYIREFHSPSKTVDEYLQLFRD